MRRTQSDNPGSEGEVEPKQDEEPKSPEKQLYPRRFPRIGSQFQTRISKDTAEPTGRPVPDRFSVDFPHLSVKDADSGQDPLSTDNGR
jgi:hypothetical protein